MGGKVIDGPTVSTELLLEVTSPSKLFEVTTPSKVTLLLPLLGIDTVHSLSNNKEYDLSYCVVKYSGLQLLLPLHCFGHKTLTCP